MSAPTTFIEIIDTVNKVQNDLSQLQSLDITFTNYKIDFLQAEKILNLLTLSLDMHTHALSDICHCVNTLVTDLLNCRIKLYNQQEELDKLLSQTPLHTSHNEKPISSKKKPTSVSHRKSHSFEWTAKGKPVCKICKRVGHVQRFCKSNLGNYSKVNKTTTSFSS